MGAEVAGQRVAWYVRHEAFGAEFKIIGPFDTETQARAYIRRSVRAMEAEIIRTFGYLTTDGTGRVTKETEVA